MELKFKMGPKTGVPFQTEEGTTTIRPSVESRNRWGIWGPLLRVQSEGEIWDGAKRVFGVLWALIVSIGPSWVLAQSSDHRGSMVRGTWSSPTYRQTVITVLTFLFLSGVLFFFLRRKNYYFKVSWASVKSWLFFAPLFFFFFGLPAPWPLVTLTLLAILGAKAFFQLMGMFHRSWFVLITYAGIVFSALCLELKRIDLYNLGPMIVLWCTLLVPLIKNDYRRMIQYIALSNFAFVLLGWAFMHTGLILQMEQGLYQLMYLIILTEFCDTTNLASSHHLGGAKLFSGLDHRRTYRSTLVSCGLTLSLAFGMRYLLPDPSEKYWWLTGIIASMGGLVGDTVMTVLRKDVGIKVAGPFILGRGDFLQRMDRLIFVAPIYYYLTYYFPGFKI